MGKQTKSPEPKPQMVDWPPYWFTRLWKGVTEGDFRKSAEAQDQLERLGYEVKVKQPSREVGV